MTKFMSIIKIFGRIGFLIILISFFMPFSLNLNGFQILEYLSGQLLKVNLQKYNPIMNNNIGFPSYGLFISSLIGLLLFIILNLKRKKDSNFLDFFIYIIFLYFLINIFIGIKKLYSDNLVSIETLGFSEFQTGAYFFIIGLIVSVVFNITYHIYIFIRSGTLKECVLFTIKTAKIIYKYFKDYIKSYKGVKMILQKFVGDIYSIIVEIILWLIPIAGFVVSGILLAGWNNNFHIGFAFLGLLAGLILDVILFGPVIIFFNMRSALKNIENK